MQQYSASDGWTTTIHRYDAEWRWIKFFYRKKLLRHGTVPSSASPKRGICVTCSSSAAATPRTVHSLTHTEWRIGMNHFFIQFVWLHANVTHFVTFYVSCAIAALARSLCSALSLIRAPLSAVNSLFQLVNIESRIYKSLTNCPQHQRQHWTQTVIRPLLERSVCI